MSATTYLKAAEIVLREANEPLEYRLITTRAIDQGLIQTAGLTPEATMNAQLAVSIRSFGDRSTFVRTAPGVFALREWLASGHYTAMPSGPENCQIRIPSFPKYDRLRAFLGGVGGIRKEDFLLMKAEVFAQRGTVQAPVDWSDPDAWIPERTEGRVRELAAHIWKATNRLVNPRYLTGHWLLSTNYELLDTDGDGLRMTDRGREFVDHPSGGVVQEIDHLEGLRFILGLVAERGPATKSELTEPFSEYAHEVSNLRAETSMQSFLWARLRNLVGRKLIERHGRSYSVTPEGVEWLDVLGGSPAGPVEPDETRHILALVQQHARQVRDDIRKALLEMDPYAFENLVKQLLIKMDYEDVQVTAKSGDGGVDVIAKIQLGITEVREVVQVKRYAKNIQRHVLDALRGSLHRFGAVRGTIITTSDYARGTKEAAFERGAAPITLINGEKLVDLMIETRVGVKKKPLELLELDLDSLNAAAGVEEIDEDEA